MRAERSPSAEFIFVARFDDRLTRRNKMVMPVINAEKVPVQSDGAQLTVECVAGQRTVTSAFARNPLKLLTPRARGQSVWAYTSSFGGGFVAGDETRLDLRIGSGARCFLGTQ